MHAAEVTWLAFALFRGLRIVSYFPQIVRAARSRRLDATGTQTARSVTHAPLRNSLMSVLRRNILELRWQMFADLWGDGKKGGRKSLHVDGTRNCEASYLNSSSLAVSG